jgi:fatty acid desaturase/predicted heme/steroid binding protein
MSNLKYSIEEISKHNTITDCWIILYGNVYDVTEFMKYHTGKYFPLQVAGKDGTGLFESIHSKKTKSILESTEFKNKYYKGKVKTNRTIISNNNLNYNYNSDLGHILKKRIDHYFYTCAKINSPHAKGGINERIYVYSKFFIITCIALYTKYHSIIKGNKFFSFLYGIIMLLIAFNIMHDANHGALIKHYPTWFSKICEYSSICVYFSPFTWKKSHNISHHQYTNSNLDEDASYYPFFRLVAYDKHHVHFKYQYIYIPLINYPITLFVKYPDKTMFIMIIIQYLFMKYNNKGGIINILIEMTTFGLLYVFINHVTHLNEKVEAHKKPIGCWYNNQLRSTSNWSYNNMFITHLLGGINYQIEHHLFQSVHHYHYPALRKIVKEICKKRKIQYNEFKNYTDAFISHYKLLKHLSIFKPLL